MRALSRRSVVVLAFSAFAIAAGVLLSWAGWPQPDRMPEFCGLILVALLASALAMQHVTAKDWTAMPPSFLVDLTTLLLLGPYAMTYVATAGAIVQGLTDREFPYRTRRLFLNAVTVIAGLRYDFSLAAAMSRRCSRRPMVVASACRTSRISASPPSGPRVSAQF